MKNFRERLARWILGYDFLSKKKSNRDLLDLLKRNDGRTIDFNNSVVLQDTDINDTLFVLSGTGNCMDSIRVRNSEIVLLSSEISIISNCDISNTDRGIWALSDSYEIALLNNTITK